MWAPASCPLPRVSGPSIEREPLWNQLAVDTDPFTKLDEMWRGVQAHAIAGSLKDRGRQGRGGPFSVRSTDVECGIATMRVADPIEQGLDRVQTQFDPVLLKMVEKFERVGAGHSKPTGGPVRCINPKIMCEETAICLFMNSPGLSQCRITDGSEACPALLSDVCARRSYQPFHDLEETRPAEIRPATVA